MTDVQQNTEVNNSDYISANYIKSPLHQMKLKLLKIFSVSCEKMHTSITEFKASLHLHIRNSEPDACGLCTLIHINGNNKLVCIQPKTMLPAKLLQCFTTTSSSTCNIYRQQYRKITSSGQFFAHHLIVFSTHDE